MKAVFFFDSMITPKIITFIYWLMLLSMVVAGIVLMFNPLFGGFFKGLLLIVFGVIFVRIWCELLMVLFKINENAQIIARNTSGSPARHDTDAIGIGAAGRQIT